MNGRLWTRRYGEGYVDGWILGDAPRNWKQTEAHEEEASPLPPLAWKSPAVKPIREPAGKDGPGHITEQKVQSESQGSKATARCGRMPFPTFQFGNAAY